MISSRVGHSLDPLLLRVYQVFFRGSSARPNLLSVIGLLFGFLCLLFTVNNWLFAAGLALFFSGLFDLFDGAVARQYAKVTTYGGFLDSVLDRYTDLSVTFGIFVNFLLCGEHLFCVLTFAAAIGMVLISYVRARAEAARLECKNGILERPERTILLIMGLCFNEVFIRLTGMGLLKPVIVLLAILTHVTAIQRILTVRKGAQPQGSRVREA